MPDLTCCVISYISMHPMCFKSAFPFFLVVAALTSNLLALVPAWATQDKPIYFQRVTVSIPGRMSIPGRNGGGAEDLLNSTAPVERGPDDATREGAMRAGMQSISAQSALLTPIVPTDYSLSPLRVTGRDASAR